MTLGAIVLPLIGLVVGLSLLYLAWRIVRTIQDLEQPPKITNRHRASQESSKKHP